MREWKEMIFKPCSAVPDSGIWLSSILNNHDTGSLLNCSFRIHLLEPRSMMDQDKICKLVNQDEAASRLSGIYNNHHISLFLLLHPVCQLLGSSLVKSLF